ncbi:shieldin complex subunit 1 isoform X2 [Elgaria multicarinata webbii]|uniref:shieldin complex subunit 1 isoform X2 n=1 Tax=Elgaria multicarinata webbii TaxID=159646 RepID=UPI002FCD61E5
MGRVSAAVTAAYLSKCSPRNRGTMEESGTASTCPSEESSLLDLPCLITAENFLLNPSTGRDDEIHHFQSAFVSSASTASDTDPDSTVFTGHDAGADVTSWPRLCGRTQPSNCVNTELFPPSELPLSCVSEELTIRKSLDTFYGTCCQKKPFGGSPAYEAASQCVCAKITDLADKEGMEYALKSLRIAQMVLNRDGNKVFPQHTSSACFSTPTNADVSSEERKQMPGLSDDILQFILKQNLAK